MTVIRTDLRVDPATRAVPHRVLDLLGSWMVGASGALLHTPRLRTRAVVGLGAPVRYSGEGEIAEILFDPEQMEALRAEGGHLTWDLLLSASLADHAALHLGIELSPVGRYAAAGQTTQGVPADALDRARAAIGWTEPHVADAVHAGRSQFHVCDALRLTALPTNRAEVPTP